MSEPASFSDLFAPEPAPSARTDGAAWKVLLVDDEPDIHAVLRLALQGVTVEGRPLVLLDARSAEDAKALLKETPDVAAILLDVVMETERAGLDLVRHIREELGNHTVQVVLVTGQPGYAPQRDVVVDYEINGYRIKSELTADKIFVSVLTALRTYQLLHRLEEQRRQTEALANTLRESEAHLHSVVETAPDAIIIADENGTVIDWNPGAERMFGHPGSEIVGQSLDLLIPERHREAHNAALARIRTGNLPQQLGKFIESEALHKDGREFPVEIVLGSWTKGGCRNFSAVMRDITERKRAETELDHYRKHLETLVEERTVALQESRDWLEQMHSAMDRTGMAVSRNDIETGRFLYVSDAACRLLGYSREELLELRISDIDPGFPPEAVWQLGQDLIVDGRGRTIETTHRHKDGSLIPVEVTANALQFAQGWCSVAYFRDISERKRIELEIRQAKEVAEAANRAKSVFLANMSHELLTPMNAIMGMTSLALRRTGDPRLVDELGKIHAASRRLLNVINDVLDISKIEAERMSLERHRFRIGEVLENVLGLIGDTAADKGLELSTDISPELLGRNVMGDSMRLGQVLLNLAGNAVKFTPAGSVTLRCRMAEDTPDYLSLRWEIADTGIGISTEERKRLFIAFEQADGSTTRKYGGAGLGLAISKRLVEMMGGKIDVDSEPGKGSTFWFTVRLEKAVEVAAAPAPPPYARTDDEHPPDDHNAELRARLATIHDLDTTAGLAMVLGNLPSYERLLKIFADGHAKDVQCLADLIGQGNLAGAEQVAHTLKGVAGNIGATTIQSLASELDTALKKGDGVTAQTAFTPLAEHLQALIDGLRAALESEPMQTVAAAPEPTPEQQQAIQELKAKLVDGDSSARDVLSAHRQSLEAALGSVRYGNVERSIQRFDFPEALRLLQE